MNVELLERLVRSSRLPTPPKVARRVVELCRRQDVTLAELLEVVLWDPALVAQTLRSVNKLRASEEPVSGLAEAVEVLGLDGMKTLALGFHLSPTIKDACGDPFDFESFWQRSYLCAATAGAVARAARMRQAEEVFTAGLLYDAGLIAMLRELGHEYLQVVKSAGASRRALLLCERRTYQLDHVEVGSAVAGYWRLPMVVNEALRHQLCPDEAPPAYVDHARAVHVGGIAAEVLLHRRHDVMADQFFGLLRRWFGIGADRGALVLRTALQAVREGDLNNVNPLGDDKAEIDKILSEAGSLLMELTARQEQQVRELTQRNAVLKQQSTTDPLTQLWNRHRFGQAMDHHFAQAGKEGWPLSVLFVDVDFFKKFNDLHGHQTGDKVLVEIAQVLKRSSPSSAITARYGGEEFVVLLPETDRVAAAKQAELMRKAVAGLKLTSDSGSPLQVTVSIGLASQVNQLFTTAASLLAGADKALYAAKAAGRNCVRVLEMKPVAATTLPGEANQETLTAA